MNSKNVVGFLKRAGALALAATLLSGIPESVSFAAENPNSLDSHVLAAEKYEQGSLGFIDWMLAKNDLTKQQKYDLEQARKIIIDASEENFSKWLGGDNTGLPSDRNNRVTCVWDDKDATSLINTKVAFSTLRDINDIRASDENYVGSMQRNPAKTNFYLMAVAQTGADRGAGLKNHSLLQVSCENLAFGGSGNSTYNPAYAWRSEIGVFNRLKESLGITVLSKESDVRAIEDLADSQDEVVGHYTNLFWAVDQVMGVGYTNYGGTSCFNASASSNYSSEYALYSIDEFEALFDEYYATVRSDAKQPQEDAASNEIADVVWSVGHKSNLTYDQSYEVGQDVKVEIVLKTSSDILENAAFSIDIGDPSILSYEPTTNRKGIMHMKGIGKTIVRIYPTGNPSKAKTYTISVTDVGGHDYTIKQAKAGAGKTTKTCSKCGYTEEVTLPTAITKITWWKNNVGTYSPVKYETGDKVKLSVSYYSPADKVDNKEFVVKVSDLSVATVSSESGYAGVLTMVGNGKATVTVYAKYDPSVKKEYTIYVGVEPENTDKKPEDTDKKPEDAGKNPANTEKDTNTVKKGTVFTTDSCQYRVTGSSEVAFIGLTGRGSKVATLKIPKTVKVDGKTFKVTSIANKAFLNAEVKSVTIGSNIKTIGVSAFEGCSKLSKVTIAVSVTSVGSNAFKNCKALKSVTLPANVTSIGSGAFSGCKKLKTIIIKSEKLTSVGRNAFKGISNFAKIKVPSKKVSSYKKLLKNKGQGKNVKISK